MNETTETLPVKSTSVFDDSERFAHVQRVAQMFSKSELVPTNFRGEGNLANCVIALEMAQRIGAAPLAVMQQIYIVHGKPGWSSQFIIACLNTCGRFEPLRFDVDGLADAKTCIAWTVAKGFKVPADVRTLKQAREASLPLFEGPPCSIGMAKEEGWVGKNGSKWKTMPELMLRYRAATWFGRLYAPELLMGMSAVDEIHDTIDVTDSGRVSAIDRPNFAAALAAEEIPGLPPVPAKDPNAPPVGELQKELADLMAKAKVPFDDFRSWLKTTGFWPDADSLESYELCPTALVDKLKADPKAISKVITIYGVKKA